MKTLLIFTLAMAALPHLASNQPPEPPKPQTDREKVLAVAASQVGVRERTGKNDGEVEKYLVAAGLGAKSQAPYCAAFITWCGKQALGNTSPYPKTAWSPDTVKGGQRVTEGTIIKGGEAFGIWFNSGRAAGRIGHCGLVERRDGSTLITIEANTSDTAASGSAADREGQGVYRKRRHWKTVHSVRDWLK